MIVFLIVVGVIAVSIGIIALFKSDLDYEDYIEEWDEDEED